MIPVGNGKVVFRVTDDGPGVPAEKIEKVFQRFYRLELHRSTPGYGLGLTLVRAIADLHGARISLDGGDKGLQFEIAFTQITSTRAA